MPGACADCTSLWPLEGRKTDCPARCPAGATERRKPATRASFLSTATGIRTPVSAVRGRRPSPLDDGGLEAGECSGGPLILLLSEAVRRVVSLVMASGWKRPLQLALVCWVPFAAILVLAYW